jgi:predicted dehydrogenase
VTRFAIVGMGSRAGMYAAALLGGGGELVAMADVNRTRMAWYNDGFERDFGVSVRAYHSDEFERMLREESVEKAIVTSVDRTHDRYIAAALRCDCDVITEKPLTIDEERCQSIVDAVNESGRQVTVCFNYRYANRNSKVKELLAAGAIGEVISVHFEWLLDTRHGADYFRRWHRVKSNSGGLMVHKASHHFDLVNWWLDSRPESIFGFGRLAFYGRANAQARGVARTYERAHGSEAARDDPFAVHLDADPKLKALYLDAEHEDGYQRDRNVFGEGIDIEDDMAVLVRYKSGATMSYHLTAYSPWEGYRVAFNGTGGRLELEAIERTSVTERAGSRESITVQRLWHDAEEVPFAAEDGTHSGADRRLLADLFSGSAVDDPLGRSSSHIDGVFAVLPGIAANRSFATGQPVAIDGLVAV